MRLEALVVCRDSEVLRLLRRVLPEMGISVAPCAGAAEGTELLKRRKFDAMVVDCELQGACEALQAMRAGASNRSCIVFALVPASMTARYAFELGANFALEKPLSLDRALRGFRAGHGLMVREARRYYRHRMELPVAVDLGGGTVQQFTITNLSEGGIAVRAPGRLPIGVTVQIKATVPHGPVIDAQAEVSWSAPDGRAGLRIISMSDACREELTAWLGRAYERNETSDAAFMPPTAPAGFAPQTIH